MELRRNKSRSLFWLFIRQLIILAFGILFELAAFVLLFIVAFDMGVLLPANYSERYLEKNKDKIAQSEPFDRTLIPTVCTYGLYDLDGNYQSGNFSSYIKKDAQLFLKDENAGKAHYVLLQRGDGYCVIQYDFSVHFKDPILHKLFPHVELSLIILFILVFFIIIIRNAVHFGKKLGRELKPVLEEIGQIQSRELSIKRRSSGITEINDILVSLYDMESALSESLKKEWETEQNKKSNISALAHDIKTPLTIIKGNSELILEAENIDEIYQSAGIINEYSDKIEGYIRLLIDETKNAAVLCKAESITLTELAEEIMMQSEALCKTSGIAFGIHNLVPDSKVLLNCDLVVRAVINLVKNAVEHTASVKRLELYIKYKERKLTVEIEDYGKGFSSEALNYAKNQFYTEKYERSEEHYGLGMYYANSVAEKYNGCITYYNKPGLTGAVVIFEIEL